MSPSADAAAPVPTSLPPLAPLVAAQLSYLLSHSKLPIRVGQIWSGCRNGRHSDRFTLSIPFCLDYVHWDFVYNALSPMVAPDVVFGQDDEGFQPLVDYADAGNDKSCLARWDYRDPRRLFALVHELRELYIEYHKKQVAKVDDARVTFELSTVLTKEGIEVCMVPSADRPDEVKFAVPLLDVDFDFNKLVPGCPWRLPQKIHLQVVEASASIGARRRFIEVLAPTFGRPIEADPIFCRRATVLSISGVFTFLVHFAIPLQFPKQQPILTLQSSQHCDADGAPIMSPPINDYPWSPRWDQAEMVERIYDFLADECQNFKKFCSDAITQQK